jgi:hypothetical protein
MFVDRQGALDGVTENGYGPTLELALGAGRTQYFLEGGVGWMTRGNHIREPGFMVRGGLGARYIARSFDFQGEGAIEMTLDGLVGAEKTWWRDDAIVRPDFVLGVGLQMRKYGDPHVMIRASIRVFFAPTPGDDPMTAARDTTPAAALTNGGLMFAVGVAR